VPRSTQNVTSNSRSQENNATVSAQNNLPNADAANTANGNQESRQEETTNYEIGRTVRTLIREQPQIKRISLAVMVDGTETPGPDGKPVWRPRADDDLARLTLLVKTAIGFNERRGDTVQLLSLPFAATEDTRAPDIDGWLGFRLEKPDLMRLAETALIGLVALVGLLSIVRPMVLRLTLASAPAQVVGGAAAGPAGLGVAGDTRIGALTHENGRAGSGAGLLEDESMVNVANVEGQVRAASLRRIADIAEKNPEETLAIMRGWMARENG